MIEVKGIKDFFAEGVRTGWKVVNAGQLTKDETIECDVVVIGTGAGGGTAAEILSQSGLRVVMIEEGPLRTSNDFRMDERDAYRDLYQEAGGRLTKDGSMIVLQGRSVGGSTTVNWTSSFRTPEQTLKHWGEAHGVKGVDPETMAPWFEKMEKRLNIAKWQGQPNNNNDVIRRGCDKLNFSWEVIPRNVNGCWNLGYCGLGCPTNAKQSMLVTTIPEALKKNAQLYYRARAERLVIDGDQVRGVICSGMKEDGVTRSGVAVTIRAKHTVMACGGINGPGLLFRSEAPDPHKLIGKRTFLHLVNSSLAAFSEKVDPFYGAPQSVYSDHFQWKQGVTGPVGYKIEVMPLQPGLASAMVGGHGEAHFRDMQRLPYLNMMISLLRDGFHEESQGGQVELRDDGTPVLSYELTDYMRDGLRRALLSMAEIQFAAGASTVRPGHRDAGDCKSWKEAQALIATLAMEKFQLRMGTAHVMGGCSMGEDPQRSVVNSEGEFHHLRNLSVMDGSLFPTSIGANPQLSIYGLVAKLATGLAKKLGDAPV